MRRILNIFILLLVIFGCSKDTINDNNHIEVIDTIVKHTKDIIVFKNNQNDYVSLQIVADSVPIITRGILSKDADFENMYHIYLPKYKNVSILNPASIRGIVCNCYNISDMDLSMCPELKFLDLSNSDTNHIDVSSCKNLESLNCSNTLVDAIDVSGCKKIESLLCCNTKIPLLDLSTCSILKELSYGGVHDLELTLPKKNILEKLTCAYLDYVDISQFPQLKTLCLDSCNIQNLDLSSCKKIEEVHVSKTCVRTLDLINNHLLTSLSINMCDSLENIKINSELTSFRCCCCKKFNAIFIDKKIDSISEVSECVINNSTVKDQCFIIDKEKNNKFFEHSYFPDKWSVLPTFTINNPDNIAAEIKIKVNFLTYIIDNNGRKQSVFPSIEPVVVKIPANGNIILNSSKFITYLDCSGTNIKTLNVNELPNLQYLDISETEILELDKGYCRLKTLNCSYTGISNISAWPCVENLICIGCKKIKDIDISKFSGSIDLSDSSVAKVFTERNFDIKSINISNCSDLLTLDLQSCNSLSSLIVDNSAKLKDVHICNCYNLKSLNLLSNKAIENINMESVAISHIELSNLPKLLSFKCVNSESHDINVLKCSSLKSFVVKNLAWVNDVDISCCEKLDNIDCSECSRLDNLSIDKCPKLESLICSETNISSLDLKELLSLKTLNCFRCKKLSSLDCSGCFNLSVIHGSSCDMLSEMIINDCSSLKDLYMVNATKLSNLVFNGCNNLEKIDLRGCSSLPFIDFTPLSKLEDITISSNSLITNLDFSNCLELNRLSVCDCSSLKLLDLGDINKIEAFFLRRCASIEDVCLSKLHSLKYLSLEFLPEMNNFSLLEGSDIINLSLDGLPLIKSIDFRIFKNLKKLALCDVDVDEVNLSKSLNLRTMYINDCTGLNNLNLSGLVFLSKYNFGMDYKSNIKILNVSKLQNDLVREIFWQNASYNTLIFNYSSLSDLSLFRADDMNYLDCSNSEKLTEISLPVSMSELKCANCPLLKHIYIDKTIGSISEIPSYLIDNEDILIGCDLSGTNSSVSFTKTINGWSE